MWTETFEILKRWRRLDIEKLHNLIYSPYKIRMIESRGVQSAWNVARSEDGINAYRVLV
jgi:hypothetical protein